MILLVIWTMLVPLSSNALALESMDPLLKKDNTLSKSESVKKSIGNPLVIVVFDKKGCVPCRAMRKDIVKARQEFSKNVRIQVYDINSRRGKIVNEFYCERFHVSKNLRLTAPALFVGDQSFIGSRPFKNGDFISYVKRNMIESNRSETPLPNKQDLELAEERINRRGLDFTWVPVLMSGFLDGINPCAFVTILFLISYLSLLNYDKKRILYAGTTFAFSVFIVYLWVGLGFMSLFEYMRETTLSYMIVRYAGIALALVVGMMNIVDFVKTRRGNLSDSKLKLSTKTRDKINAVIRQKLRTSHVMIGAIVVGFAVSILEFSCTGQGYLPTLVFIVKQYGIAAKATLMLIAYNLAFIFPLILIIILFYAGTSHKTLANWLTKHGGAIKLCYGIVLVAIAILLWSS